MATAVAPRPPQRTMTAQQRAQRRQDLLLAADALRQRVGVDLAHLRPAAQRVLTWVDAGLWLRRHWHAASPGQRLAGTVLALAGGGMWRQWRWLGAVLVAWRLWRQLRPAP